MASQEQKGGGGNMYSQLEAMMTAVKREAAGLEVLKSKLKDMDDLKRRNADLKDKLQASELANSDLHQMLETAENNASAQRGDMQHLNDIYNEEREMHLEVQQKFLMQEQELVHLRGEVSFAQREAAKVQELRKNNQTAQGQLAGLEKRLEDERLEWTRSAKGFEEKISDAQRVKDEVSNHVWNLTEEIKGLRGKLERADRTEESLQEALRASQRDVVQANERAFMGTEDRLALSIRKDRSEKAVSQSFRELQREVMRLQNEVTTKDEQMQINRDQLKALEGARAGEKTQVRAKMNDLLDALAAARQSNTELEARSREARRAADESHKGMVEAEGQVDNLTQSLATVNGELASREEDLKRAKQQVEEYKQKAMSSSHHFEAMQNQVRDGQAKYWGELQSMKEKEGSYIAEIESLTADLEEKRSVNRILEAEKSEMERMIVQEQGHATEAQTALRNEVERQKEELHAARTERDKANEEKEKLQLQLTDHAKTIKKNETMYQRALESDRSKIQHEIRVKLGRMKSMEEEKQELLKELEELMLQISENQKEISRLKVELEASKRQVQDLELQYTATLTDKEELVQEVKMAGRKEKELRDTATRLDAQFRENIAKLEVMVKESKKTAAAQVAEISNRVKSAVDEAEECRRERDKLVESERYALQEVEKYKTEIELLKRSHDDMQLQMARESAAMKQELSDSRGKMKLMQESKSKTDTETMRVRLDQTRLENETARLKEIIKDHETKGAAAAQDLVDIRSELAKVNELYRNSKARVIDFEQKDLRRDKKVEDAMEEMARMENQHKMEQRRLRVARENMESEANELRGMLSRVQKEAADAKANLTKVQTSSNSTINGLLEELKKTEETLSKERRKGQSEIMEYHSRIGELQTSLEQTKDSMEEDLAKTKSAVSNKEHRLIQLEGENTRMRNAMNDKDDRIMELERGRQADRSKMMELKDAVASKESALDSCRTELELEQGLRQRLEAKVKDLQVLSDESRNRVGDSAGAGTSEETVSSFMHDHADSHRLKASNIVPKSPIDASEDGSALQGTSAVSSSTSELVTNSGAVYGYEPMSVPEPMPSQRRSQPSYDDDILAGVASPPRRDGSSRTDFDAIPSRHDDYARQVVAEDVRADMLREEAGGGGESTSAVVDRVTAALSARLKNNGSRPGSEGEEGRPRVGLVSELRDTTLAASLMDDFESDPQPSYAREDDEAVGTKEGGDVEASIQRTQEFLRMRLAARGGASGGDGDVAPNAPVRGDRGYSSPVSAARVDPIQVSPEVKGATFLYSDAHHDDFGAKNSGHLGPVRDEPDVLNRLPYKTQNITLAGSHDMDTVDGKGSMDKDAILFGAPRLSPPQPGRAGVGIQSVASGLKESSPRSSPERRLKSHTKLGNKGKLKKLSISMSDADAADGDEKPLPRIASGSNVLKHG